MKNRGLYLWILLLSFLPDSYAYAGMPSIMLTEMASIRLSNLSFFFMLYLLASFIIYKLWNYLRKDFTKLPLLSYRRSLLLIFVWGMAFHLVLTMISGTRELMTPKAWEQAGIIHKMSPEKLEQSMNMRRHNLEKLRKELWHQAKTNNNNFGHISKELLLTADGKDHYVYIEKQSINHELKVLLYEPESFGQERFVLFTNGMIDLMHINMIHKRLQ